MIEISTPMLFMGLGLMVVIFGASFWAFSSPGTDSRRTRFVGIAITLVGLIVFAAAGVTWLTGWVSVLETPARAGASLTIAEVL